MLRKRKGMTLVEIVVAMAVFAIVISALLPAFLFAARLNIVSKVGIDVTAIARQEAEKFYGYSRKYTFTDTINLPELNMPFYTPSGTSPEIILTRDDNTNHVTIKITLWDNNPQDGMTKIRILVTIKGGYNTQNALPEQIDSILLFK